MLSFCGFASLSASEPGWRLAGISIENDVLMPHDRDERYTAGIQVDWRRTSPGDSTLDLLAAPAEAMGVLLGFPVARDRESPSRLLSAGLAAYTPRWVVLSEVVEDDRPFSSLLFFSYGGSFTRRERDFFTYTGTIGLLGTTAAEKVQRLAHDYFPKARQPEGWDNQISDGGEPTLQFDAARSRLLVERGSGREALDPKLQVWAGPGLGVGYRTHVSVHTGFSLGYHSRRFYENGAYGLSLAKTGSRWGRIPASTASGTVGGAGEGVLAGLVPDEGWIHGWATGAYIPYDVSLQGQFRDSALEVGYDDRYPGRLFGGLGLSLLWNNGVGAGVQWSYESAEIRDQPEGHSYGSVYVQFHF